MLAGVLGGGIGAIVSALVIVGALMATGTPPEGVQQASYRSPQSGGADGSDLRGARPHLFH